MNVTKVVSVPAGGLANMLTDVVGQQVGPGEFEQFRVKLTCAAADSGKVKVTARASGRVLKDASVVRGEPVAGEGPSELTSWFVNELVARGEQLFLEAQGDGAGTVDVTMQAESVPL